MPYALILHFLRNEGLRTPLMYSSNLLLPLLILALSTFIMTSNPIEANETSHRYKITIEHPRESEIFLFRNMEFYFRLYDGDVEIRGEEFEGMKWTICLDIDAGRTDNLNVDKRR